MQNLKQQLDILRHTIGEDLHGDTFQKRNHYVAGGDDVTLCRELVELGYMVEHRATDLSGGDPWFHVTQEGNAFVAQHRVEKPKLSRSKKRYLNYLNSDSWLSFGEWLKFKHYKEDHV
jgi:hypothetical protein